MQVPHGLEELVRSQLTDEWIAEKKAAIKAEVNALTWEHLALDGDDSYEVMLGNGAPERIDQFESLLDAGLSIFHVGTCPRTSACPRCILLLVSSSTI